MPPSYPLRRVALFAGCRARRVDPSGGKYAFYSDQAHALWFQSTAATFFSTEMLVTFRNLCSTGHNAFVTYTGTVCRIPTDSP
jgi:hypothetical protein